MIEKVRLVFAGKVYLERWEEAGERRGLLPLLDREHLGRCYKTFFFVSDAPKIS